MLRWASESRAELTWNRERDRQTDRAVSSWVPDLKVEGPGTYRRGVQGPTEAHSRPASCSIWETEVPLGIPLDAWGFLPCCVTF